MASKLEKTREKPGGSNAGKYKNTRKRGESAIKLAHNAPNPDGIKSCVYRKYPDLKPNSLMRNRKK